jgi:protein-disulfide isomerase-like protein with CxxC motif
VRRQFSISFDYRCPFARNAHESVVSGLRAGREWDVTFVPFSLDQVHVEEGETPVWDRPPAERGTGVLALQWGIAVRDAFSDRFLDYHLASFAARHDHGRKLVEEAVLRDVASSTGLDPDAVAEEVATGRPLATLATEHADHAKRLGMFGVPTFVLGDTAVFVRLMARGHADDVELVLDLLDRPGLNELKHTRIPR